MRYVYDRTRPYIGPFLELLAESRNFMISCNFVYGLQEGFYTKTPVTTGAGTVTAADSLAVINGGGTGTAELESYQIYRYKNGVTGGAWFTASFTGNGQGDVRFGNSTDGWVIRRKAGQMSVLFIRAGVETLETPEVEWLGATGDMPDPIEWTGLNIYFVEFGYLGIYPGTIYVCDPEGTLLCTHRFKTSGGVRTTTHVKNPTLPISMEATGDMVIKTGSWSAWTLGTNGGINNRGFYWPNDILTNGFVPADKFTLSGTTLKTLALMRVNDTFNGVDSRISVRLTEIELTADVPTTTDVGNIYAQIIRLTNTATQLSGTPTWTDHVPNESVLQICNNGVTYVSGTGGRPILTQHVAYLGTKSGAQTQISVTDPEKWLLNGRPGEVYAVVAVNPEGHNVSGRWSIAYEVLL